MQTTCFDCFSKYEGGTRSLYCPTCRKKRLSNAAKNRKLNEIGGMAYAKKCEEKRKALKK